MEYVNVQVPAYLYCKIYDAHQEQTTAIIQSALESIFDHSPVPVKAKSLRPGAGTITGRVWEIADQLILDGRDASRALVVETCMSEGINMNTANTQFSNWAKENS